MIVVNCGGEGGDLFLHPLQLFGVVLMEDVCELVHAVPKASVPSLFVLLGQLDPGLQSDGESGWCGMIGDVFVEYGELTGMLCFMMVELNQFVEGGGGGVCGGLCGYGGGGVCGGCGY